MAGVRCQWRDDISEYDVEEYGEEHQYDDVFNAEMAAWEQRKL